MAKFDRSKFKIGAEQAKKYAKNSDKIHREYKPAYIDWESLPVDLPMYKEIVCKDADDFAENILTVLPYVIESNNNTWVSSGVTPIGGIAYQNRVIRHNDIVQGKQAYLCKKQMYGRRCSFCDQRSMLYQQNQNVPKYSPPEHLKFLKTSTRDLMLVIPQVGEQTGKLCLWEVSNYLFTNDFETEKTDWKASQEKERKRIYDRQQEIIKAGGEVKGNLITAEDLKVPDFTDPDSGADVRFIIRGKGLNKKYSSIKFFQRDEPIADEMLDKTFDIAAYFKVPTDEQVDTLLQEALDTSVEVQNGVETADDSEEMEEYKLPDTSPAEQIEVPPVPPEEAAEQAAKDSKACPHGIEKKFTAAECMQCEIKNSCERN